MSARLVRFVVVGVCVAGVAGMIVSSVLGHNGAALTFGLITAVAVLCLMVATAVSAGARPGASHPDPETQAAQVEQEIGALLAGGADEQDVRRLVRAAVRLGRLSGPPTP